MFQGDVFLGTYQWENSQHGTVAPEEGEDDEKLKPGVMTRW